MMDRIFVLLLVGGAFLGVLVHGARSSVSENSVTMKDVPVVASSGQMNQDKQRQQASLVRNKDLSSFEEDLNSEKRQQADGSHFRLFYKSNTPERSISHRLEHRYYKNPNQNYYSNNGNLLGSNQYEMSPNQYSGSFAFNNQYMWPLPANKMVSGNFKPSEMSSLENKNRQTMLNIHYHGQNLDDIDGLSPRHPNGFKSMGKNYQTQASPFSNKMNDNNMLKMILMNFKSNNMAPGQQFSAAPGMFAQQRPQVEPFNFNSLKDRPYNLGVYGKNKLMPILNRDDNAMQYRIVHLKFKMEPQYGKVVGQGYVETNSGAGVSPILNSKHFRLMPNELPELVKRLIQTTQNSNSPMMPNRMANPVPYQRVHYIRKRHDDSASEYSDQSEYEDGNDNDDDSFDAANTSNNSADDDQIYTKKRAVDDYVSGNEEIEDGSSELDDAPQDMTKRSIYSDESSQSSDLTDEQSNVDSLEGDEEGSSGNKRSVDDFDERRKRESEYNVEDRTNDNELEESFKNLKRREFEYEGGSDSASVSGDSNEVAGNAEEW